MNIKIMAIAACFLSGIVQPVIAGIVKVNAQKTETTILYASASDENVLELPDIEAGVFSNAVVRALSGEADKNHDGVLSQREFIAHVEIDTQKKSAGRQSVRVVNPWRDAKSPVCGKVTYLLAVGINYTRPQEKRISPFRYAVSDARNIASSIQKRCGETNIVTYTDELATKKAIYETIDRIICQSNPGDTIIITYSGYGTQIEERHFMLPNDASNLNSAADVEKECAEIDHIIEALSRSKTKHALLLLDTCFKTLFR